MNIFARCWRGEAPLWQAFWIILILIPLLINTIFFGIIWAMYAPDFYQLMSPDSHLTMVEIQNRMFGLTKTPYKFYLPIIYCYYIYAAICVWRCGKNSAEIWSILSKIFVVAKLFLLGFYIIGLFRI